MITIVNKHHDSSGVYVGRPTVLGNPYTLQAYTRTDAITRQQWQRQDPAGDRVSAGVGRAGRDPGEPDPRC